MRTGTKLLSALLAALGGAAAMAQTNVDSPRGVGWAPEFQEVYQVLRANLEGVNAAELDRASVQGLIHQLEPRVSLLAAGAASSNLAPLANARVFDQSFAYVRVAGVTSNLPGAFDAAYHQMMETNKGKIRGLALDLRFAGGFNYAAAAKLADAFLNSDRPLLNWQTGSAHATLKGNAITLPVAILVNAQTSGAAEALAAVLRESGVGLILGGQTAGQAAIFREFPLRDGRKLRVAVAQVSYGAGKTLPHGVAPDIAIETSLEDERAYLQDPCKVLHPGQAAQTDLAKEAQDQPLMNEVELIREHRRDLNPEATPAANAPDQREASPVVADPALARALDLLKGLAVVEPNRPG